jgi:energy-coupling factor transporter ATP-binding protein EcfA2
VAIKKRTIAGPGFRLIKRVEIRYLRSLYRATIGEPGDLNLIFGRNDSGKSNFLRALNLFFNGRTGALNDLDFSIDFSDIRRREARDAKGKQFISIRVDFNVPSNFRNSLGHEISIKRQWNINGDMTETPPRNLATGTRIQLTKFLNQIDYTYVPAIKDVDVFGDLIERMYDATATKLSLRASVEAFVNTIQSETAALSKRLAATLATGTQLAAPNQMGRLFRTMDFELGEDNHSLILQKGDGIKARHIPELLRYINENEEGKKFFVWGFEEPENSLDLSAAESEAANFAQIASREDTQIFISSHSPAFYLAEPPDRSACVVKRYFICKQEKISGSVKPEEAVVSVDTIDQAEEVMESASLMQLPYLIRKVSDHRVALAAREAELEQVKQSMLLGKPTVFVEGPSDRIVFDRALKLFFPGLKDSVRFETRNGGAGDSYVVDMLAAWRNLHKHDSTKPKCAGILDRDLSNGSVVDKVRTWNEVPGNTSSAKLFYLKKPAHVLGIFKAGMSIPIVLETLYPIAVWRYAEKKGYLEDVQDVSLRFSRSAVNAALIKGASPLTTLNDDQKLLVLNQVNALKKVLLATYVTTGDEELVLERLHDVKSSLEQALVYLGFDLPAHSENQTVA